MCPSDHHLTPLKNRGFIMASTNHTSGVSFSQLVHDPSWSTGDLILSIGLGQIDPPAVIESATARWLWFADLLDDPSRGVAAGVPALGQLCSRVAELCRQTAHTVRSKTLVAQWTSAAEDIAVARRTHRGSGVQEAADMLEDLTIDAFDLYERNDVTGAEAFLSYITTLKQIPSKAVRETLAWAAEWNVPPVISAEPEILRARTVGALS